MRPTFLLFLLFLSLCSKAQQLPLIPYPAKIENDSEAFVLTAQTVIYAPDSFEADFLQKAILSQTGLRLPIVKKATGNAIRLNLFDGTVKDDEAYRLNVGKNEIRIIAPSTTGIFYGIQTLLQLLPNKPVSSATVPGVSITDKPKYKWRGMHLDVARHFFPVDFVKEYIDYLAMYK